MGRPSGSSHMSRKSEFQELVPQQMIEASKGLLFLGCYFM